MAALYYIMNNTWQEAQSRRSEPFGGARAACFEREAGVFADRGAVEKVGYWKNFVDVMLSAVKHLGWSDLYRGTQQRYRRDDARRADARKLTEKLASLHC